SLKTAMFTFESSVHPNHVLRSLEEQRQRDILCDVTVVTAEGQSFRAHRAVLASCSEYFSQRISSLAGQNPVITLPSEVTAAGFEPLLKFSYTSKLLFGKEDVLDIQTSASALGFKDLDGACFDFLLPKFFSSTKACVICGEAILCTLRMNGFPDIFEQWKQLLLEMQDRLY
uniref:BTB domain-containing protein n=1 Tax=Periophthalmus magnuspinnatus TaxID=409849 RepID=A0A3B4APV9_9GOBI